MKTHKYFIPRVLNEMVDNAAELMEEYIKSQELIASQFDNKDPERAAIIRQDIPDIQTALAVMRKRSGNWV